MVMVDRYLSSNFAESSHPSFTSFFALLVTPEIRILPLDRYFFFSVDTMVLREVLIEKHSLTILQSQLRRRGLELGVVECRSLFFLRFYVLCLLE